MIHRRFDWSEVHLVLLALFISGVILPVAAAEPAQPACKKEIVDILAGMEALPPHEETKTTIHENKKNPGASFEKASDKRTVVRRVAPDRYTFTMWKQGTLRLESVTIGKRTWDREPGTGWTLQPSSRQTELTDSLAARIADTARELNSTIEEPGCHGLGERAGKPVLRYTYRLLLSDFELWVDSVTRHPVEERMVIELPALNARSVTTRHFKYDPSMRVEAPE
jgi:hypothetical protein